MGRKFETHWRHCVMSLSKTLILCLVLVQPMKTGKCLNMTENLKIVDWDVKCQHKEKVLGNAMK